MARITVSKPVDPAALKATLGVDVLTSGGDEPYPTTFDVIADVDEATLQAAIDGHTAPPDPTDEFTAALAGIDTSKIGDAATKAALEAVKAALSGGKGPGAEPRRGR